MKLFSIFMNEIFLIQTEKILSLPFTKIKKTLLKKIIWLGNNSSDYFLAKP